MEYIVEDKCNFIKIEYDKKTIYMRKSIILSIELTINKGLSM